MRKFLALWAAAQLFAFGAAETWAADMNATVMQEVYYNMLERQLRREVEQAFISGGIDPSEAELNVAYLKAQIDMLEIKERTMACFQEHQIGFMQVEDRTEATAECLADYRAQLALFNEMSKDVPNLDEGVAAAAYFVPAAEEVVGTDNEKLLAVIKNVAANLALSRMDVKSLHRKMLQCMQEQPESGNVAKTMACSDETREIFRREMLRAMDELMPYAAFFARLMLKAEGRVP